MNDLVLVAYSLTNQIYIEMKVILYHQNKNTRTYV